MEIKSGKMNNGLSVALVSGAIANLTNDKRTLHDEEFLNEIPIEATSFRGHLSLFISLSVTQFMAWMSESGE